MATTQIVCDSSTENSIDCLDGFFRLTDDKKRVMRGNLTGLVTLSSPFWAWPMFRLKKEGAVRQKLNLTLGSAELWAFSMTAEDVALRERLYARLGPRLARMFLARRFPGGTARTEFESRITRFKDTDCGPGSGKRGVCSGGPWSIRTLPAYLLIRN